MKIDLSKKVRDQVKLIGDQFEELKMAKTSERIMHFLIMNISKIDSLTILNSKYQHRKYK